MRLLDNDGWVSAPPRKTLFVGSDAFWRQAERDIRGARKRVYVQAMTFEADAAGEAVARAISGSAAVERKVLVDDFTRYVVSDAFVYSPRYLFDRGFRREVRRTRAMFSDLRREGVGVRVTNPGGMRLDRAAFRNHKKLIVADDVAYIGGINFSDHNFQWGDLMLRIEDPVIASRLAVDFGDTFAGRPRSWVERFPGVGLYGMDGRDNPSGFADLLAEIDRAQDTICVVSPYLTFPFLDALERAAERGVAVQLITPLANNKPIVRDYLLPAAHKAGFDVRLTPEMIHTKGMLLDGRTLVLGSSNFDFVSYHAEAEFVAILRDEGLAHQFQRSVIEPFLARAVPAADHHPSALRSILSRAALRIAAWLIQAVPSGNAYGASEWS
ncbi:MAG: phosphatidylserine/phosphatidylglycerophosphate/cardiolipin synthase family protein [Caulobacteraceae bacterium]